MKKFSFFFIFIVAFALIAGFAYFLLKDMSPPKLTLSPNTSRTSPNQEFTITISDEQSYIKNIVINIRKNNISANYIDYTFPNQAKQQQYKFTLKDANLRDGNFSLEIKTTDSSFAGFGRGNSVTEQYEMRFDTQPPKITIHTMPPYIRKGGPTCIVFTANKQLESAGIKIDNLYFPAYKQDNNQYICFFAFPYYLDKKDFSPQLFIKDIAGNELNIKIPHYIIDRKFKTDKLNLPDSFLESKNQEFSQIVPGNMSPLERYLKVNRDIREQNAETILKLGKKSENTILWEGAFARLPNSANRAGFAEARTYLYNGQEIDQQTHLGLDLASLQQAHVPAGNNGVIIFADYLGIYGNMIIIDHGLGLQSLYSHLSSITVNVGDTVTKGQTIGQTGSTGLAGGDHLHFAVLISGIPVSPIEWLDPKWIKDNVMDRIKP